MTEADCAMIVKMVGAQTYKGVIMNIYTTEEEALIYKAQDGVKCWTTLEEAYLEVMLPAMVYISTYQDIDIYLNPATDIYWFVYAASMYEFGSVEDAYNWITTYVIPPEEVPEEVVPVEEVPPEEVPVEEVPPEEVVPVFESPSLPWYASWLKPVIDYWGLLSENVVNFFAPLFEPLGKMATNVLNLPKNLIDGAIENIGKALSRGRDRGALLAVETTGEVVEGTPEWMAELQANLEAMYAPIVESYVEAIAPETYEKSPLTGEEAVAALGDMKTKLVATAIANFTLHAIVESGSLGQFEFMKELDGLVTSKFGLGQLVERATMLPIEKAVLIPAEYEWNVRHPNMIPTYTDLINMVVKEVIPLDRFVAEMAKLGFKTEWAKFIWDAHFRPPDWTQLLQAYYRGAITQDELMSLKVLVDLDPRYDVVWNSLIEVIPPYSELINMLVKEVISLDEFNKYLRWHGFDETWGKRIWDAHFIPPTLGDILTAWRRKLITEEQVDELMILVDLDPRFKEIFDTRKYADPTVTMARYMFETRAIDAEGVKNIVQRAGFLPQDVDALATFIVKFQERRFQRRYLTALEAGVVKGAYTPEELSAEVVAAGYTAEVAGWMLKTAEVRRRIALTKPEVEKARILTLGDLKKAYVRDILEEDAFRTELGVRGFEIGDVDVLIEVLSLDKVVQKEGRKIVALSISQVLNALRYDVISEDEARTMLQLRGLDTTEVDTLLETKKRQWGVSPA